MFLQMWMNVLKTLMAVVRPVAILTAPSCVLVVQGSLWQMTIWVVMVSLLLPTHAYLAM